MIKPKHLSGGPVRMAKTWVLWGWMHAVAWCLLRQIRAWFCACGAWIRKRSFGERGKISWPTTLLYQCLWESSLIWDKYAYTRKVESLSEQKISLLSWTGFPWKKGTLSIWWQSQRDTQFIASMDHWSMKTEAQIGGSIPGTSWIWQKTQLDPRCTLVEPSCTSEGE